MLDKQMVSFPGLCVACSEFDFCIVGQEQSPKLVFFFSRLSVAFGHQEIRAWLSGVVGHLVEEDEFSGLRSTYQLGW